MGMRVTWDDNNFGEDGHKIYRDTSPMDPAALPSPLAVVGGDVTQYDDGSALDGVTYYYRVSATLGALEIVSDEVMYGGFTPSSLFSSGEFGSWYDPSDISTLFIDDAGTTPVTSDGDPVGRIEDKSGNGIHLIQSVAASRPIYKTNGTLHWLEFDGVDDYIESPDLAGNIFPSAGCLAASFENSAANAVSGVFQEYSASDSLHRVVLYSDTRSNPKRQSNTKMTGLTDSYIDLLSQSSAGQAYVSILNSDGSIGTGYLNGASQGTAVASASFTSPTRLALGYQTSLFHSGAIYGVVSINRNITDAERTDIDTYLGNLAGLSI